MLQERLLSRLRIIPASASGGSSIKVLEFYSSNFDNDKNIAQEMLRVFYGRRDHSVEEMSDDKVIKLAAVYAALAQAHATRELQDLIP